MINNEIYAKLVPFLRRVKRSPSFHGLYIDRLARVELEMVLTCGANSTLVIGPFVGEFGWEVSEFQGYVRFLSKRFKRTIVISRPENEALYTGCNAEFVGYHPGTYNNGYFFCHEVTNPFHFDFPSDSVWLDPSRTGPHFHKYFRQDFDRFGRRNRQVGFDVVLHGRNFSGAKSGNNWQPDSWQMLAQRLLDAGLTVAAIGLPSLSVCPSGVVDCRQEKLQGQMDILASSRLCVGPSSGAIHLALLCACPVLVWTQWNTGVEFGGVPNRYVNSWNPLSTSVRVMLTEAMKPSIECVYSEVQKTLNILNTRSVFEVFSENSSLSEMMR